MNKTNFTAYLRQTATEIETTDYSYEYLYQLCDYLIKNTIKFREHELKTITKKQSKLNNPDTCAHEYHKTLAKSGMYIIDMCRKCHHQKKWISESLEKCLIPCQHTFNKGLYTSQGSKVKCKKCGEYFEVSIKDRELTSSPA